MSLYREILKDAVKVEGLKKMQSELLRVAGIIDRETSGQIVCHVDHGIVTEIYYHNVRVKVN